MTNLGVRLFSSLAHVGIMLLNVLALIFWRRRALGQDLRLRTFGLAATLVAALASTTTAAAARAVLSSVLYCLRGVVSVRIALCGSCAATLTNLRGWWAWVL